MTNVRTDHGAAGAVVRSRSSYLVPLVLAGGVCTALGVASTLPSFVQGALAVCAALLLCLGCIRAPASALVALVAWLTVLATIRRVLDAAGVGVPSSPLLLVSPAAVAVLVAVAARRGAFRARTQLANSVLFLTVLVILSAGNPLQGGAAVGIAGLLFVLVPMLWFWLGRAVLTDQALGRLLEVISILAVLAGIYGLFQVYRGFPTWDAEWIAAKGYVALKVGDSSRQFASFASTSEYVGFLAIGMLVWATKIRRVTKVVPAGIAITVIGWALAVASARAILVMLPVALGLVFAASRGFGFARSVLFGLAGLLILGGIVSTFDAGSVGGSKTSALLSRQVQGLSDPFNSNVSTLPGHISELLGGLGKAAHNPIGQGVGSVTAAAERFGGQTAGTEADPSNIAVATGAPGLVAYFLIVLYGFRLAFRTAREHRDVLSLVALGVLVVTLFQWLNGGTYAVAPLPWLMLGWLDRRSISASSSPQPAIA